jgi:hypothetical protein
MGRGEDRIVQGINTRWPIEWPRGLRAVKTDLENIKLPFLLQWECLEIYLHIHVLAEEKKFKVSGKFDKVFCS